MDTKKFGGKTFMKAKTFHYKADADKFAKMNRDKGNLARVVKEPYGYCVYVRG